MDDDLCEEGDDDVFAAKSTPSPGTGVGVGLPWVIVAVLAGILIVVIGMIGRDSGSSPTTETSQPVPTSTVDTKARRAELEAVIASNPDNADAHLELGVILFNTEDFVGAKAHWDIVVALDPTEALAWYNLGFYYLSQTPTDHASAQAAWEKVIELDPDSDLAHTVADHVSAIMPPSASASSSTNSTGG